MFERIATFWDERKRTKLGQLHLLWIISVVLCVVAAARSSELSLREKLAFGLGSTVLIYVGLIICYFVPSLYLDFIRRRKEEQKPVVAHRVLFALYIFPVIPFVFAAVVALVASTGIFGK